MNTDLIARLRNAAPEWVSSEELRQPSGVSRAAISKQIQVLRGLGYGIESVPRKGYRLVEDVDALDEERMKPFLAGGRFEQGVYIYRDAVGSTNDEVRKLAGEGAPEGSLVVAEIQEQGRGRRGRTWFGRAGDCLQFSVLLRPPLRPQEATLIPLLAATSVFRALRGAGVEGAGIKWPNDVLIGGRKCCGVLCEMSVDMEGIQYAMLGIGLNVNTPAEAFPAEIAPLACSLRSSDGKNRRRSDLLIAILTELDRQLAQAWDGEVDQILEAWKEGAVTLGKAVRIQMPNGSQLEGTAVDVDRSGALILRDASGERHILHSGEISLRGH